jgi:hypothetical protein
MHASIWPANGKRVLPLETTDNTLSAVQRGARRAGGVPCGASSRVTRGTLSCNVACGVQRRQPPLLQSTADGSGKHLARPILEIRHEHRLVWGELEHARARPIYRYPHAAAPFVGLFPFPFVRFSLALVFFTFPRVCVFVLLVVPPRMTHHTPCGRATISVGRAHDAGCASRLCTHLGSLRPTISGAASTSSAKCAIWRSNDQPGRSS